MKAISQRRTLLEETPNPDKNLEGDFNYDDPKIIKSLLKSYTPKVVHQLCQAAADGSSMAAKLFVQLALPKDGIESFVQFTVPDNLTVSDTKEMLNTILKEVGQGNMSLGQAQQLASIVDTLAQASKMEELQARILDLELAQHNKYKTKNITLKDGRKLKAITNE